MTAEWRVVLAGLRPGDRPGGERHCHGGEGAAARTPGVPGNRCGRWWGGRVHRRDERRRQRLAVRRDAPLPGRSRMTADPAGTLRLPGIGGRYLAGLATHAHEQGWQPHEVASLLGAVEGRASMWIVSRPPRRPLGRPSHGRIPHHPRHGQLRSRPRCDVFRCKHLLGACTTCDPSPGRAFVPRRA